MTLMVLPWRMWSLRSTIPSHIHIAGRIWISVSRQLEKTSPSPWKSIVNAPTTSASGASHRRD